MKRLKLSDDEAIRAAQLLGCEFWLGDKDGLWYVHDDIENPHPIELQRFDDKMIWAWKTKPALARAFVRYHLESNHASD